MSDTVIKVENLGKKYILNHQQEGRSKYKALRDVIADGVKSLGSRIKNPKFQIQNNREEFWALKDVSFEIKQGDRVGIIGRNGAGKSTLLKILSRITEPTTGRISIKGRVASLLEVGTGFHPELTGRENIYLNGAILGMSRAEIKRKFDEIVGFAEVEKFLDTPVKKYSSGMYVRLAFAVAAHLEPEILVVDEVLAVGDAQFQKKCLGKMEEAGKEGRTVLFVSHNMGTIFSLCSRALLLHHGECIGDGEPKKLISEYLNTINDSKGELVDNTSAATGKKLKLRKLKVSDKDGKISSEFELQDDVFLEIDYEVIQAGRGYNISFEISSFQQGCIFTSASMDLDPINLLSQHFEPGYYTATIKLPTEIMRQGDYNIKVASTIPTVEVLDIFNKDLCFRLIDASSPIAKTGEGRNGSILPILSWKITQHKISQN